MRPNPHRVLNLAPALGASRRSRGQTLVIAIIILGVLLILGLVFAGIVGRTIIQAGVAAQRTVAGDLSRAGAEYAHYQLQFSSLGADWRPTATGPDGVVGGLTRDPDALYLRPGSGLAFPGTQFADQGGPDGLGAYSRVFFDNGRALVRVRYAPNEFDAFADPTGNLRQPGAARNYLIIESIGRPGSLRTGGRVDPSLLLPQAVQVSGYSDTAELSARLGEMRNQDATVRDTSRVIAFASLGMLESARFITNRDRVTRPAEIGIPAAGATADAAEPGLGVTYDGEPVRVRSLLGGLFRTWTNGNGANVDVFGAGSLWSNADLRVYGTNDVVLNASLGDMWAVAGRIQAASDLASLRVTRYQYNPATQTFSSTLQQLSGAQLNSNNPGFTTVGGVVRDGAEQPDSNLFPRAIRRKEPPSILAVEPQSNLNRFAALTRQSGAWFNGRNIGRFGYGRGVYVDARERGNLNTEDQREQQGAVRSLPNDWLNPNNETSLGWQGPFYRPIATFLRLTPDGFEIIRDSRSRSRFWRFPDGSSTNTSRARYRLRTIGGQTYILNSLASTQPANAQPSGLADRPGSSLSDADFRSFGQPFNGVLMFEGDVRVRGVIPTDHQLTVVSMGSVYIDGSIVKGTVTENGTTLNRPSRSALALMARDYVTLNTTQFFAPAPGEDPKVKSAQPLADAPNPVELDFADAPSLRLQAQFLTEPVGSNPSAFPPMALNYTEFGSGDPLPVNLLMSVSADDNGPAYISMDLGGRIFADPNPGALTSPYLFGRTLSFGSAGSLVSNAADPLFAPGGSIPLLGLGNPPLNAYPRFETVSLPLVSGAWSWSNGDRFLTAPGGWGFGSYRLGLNDETEFNLRLNPAGVQVAKNFLVSRLAIAPHDIRIEAALFAEQGSFFVIPGQWFNMNLEDTRARFAARVSAIGLEAAQRERYELYGADVNMPFYAEPLAARVTIVGSITENMPAPISQASEWLRKWGWIPPQIGSSGNSLPAQFVPSGLDFSTEQAPNLILRYDPMLATGSADGFSPVRVDEQGRALPPMPRLPVSPTLAYFGEVNP